jgi:hypothetical protein
MARPAVLRAWREFVVEGCTSVRLGKGPSNSAWPESLGESATFQAGRFNRQGTYNPTLIETGAFLLLIDLGKGFVNNGVWGVVRREFNRSLKKECSSGLRDPGAGCVTCAGQAVVRRFACRRGM